MKFTLRTAFAASHRFCIVVFSLSFASRYFLISSLISLLTHWFLVAWFQSPCNHFFLTYLDLVGFLSSEFQFSSYISVHDFSLHMYFLTHIFPYTYFVRFIPKYFLQKTHSWFLLFLIYSTISFNQCILTIHI